jgi:hypothetical protein
MGRFVLMTESFRIRADKRLSHILAMCGLSMLTGAVAWFQACITCEFFLDISKSTMMATLRTEVRKLVNNTQKLETAKKQIDDVLTQTRLLCRNCLLKEFQFFLRSCKKN